MSKEKLIIALDVESADDAIAIVEELRQEVGAFKIGLQLYSSSGPAFVKKLVDDGVKIFLDLKFHDIPNTVMKASIEVTRLGVWMFNVHAAGGHEMMRAACEAARRCADGEGIEQPKVIGVTVLTSGDARSLAETGVNSTVADQVMRLARLANRAGLDGVVASPLEIEIVRRAVDRKGFLIVTPGIRGKSETRGDQKRVMTASDAVSAGSDYIVVGRPVLNSGDRIAAVREIVNEASAAAARHS